MAIALKAGFSTYAEALAFVTGITVVDKNSFAIAGFYDPTTNKSGTILRQYNSSSATLSDTTETLIEGVSFGSAQFNADMGLEFLDAQGNVFYTLTGIKASLALDNVENYSSADMPLSTLVKAALLQKVDKVTDMGLSSNDFTTAEKEKLAGLESPLGKGWFDSESALLTAYPNGSSDLADGSYAFVTVTTTDDDGNDVTTNYRYSYSTTDAAWSNLGSISEATLTPAEIKTQYESNEDTNAYTDAEKSKLEGLTAGGEPNSVETVNNVSPDSDKNITLTPSSLGLSNDYASYTPSTLPVSTPVQNAIRNSFLNTAYTYFIHSKSWRSQTFSIDPYNKLYMKVSSQGDHFWLRWNKTETSEPDSVDIVIACNAFGYDGKGGYFNSGEYGQDMTITNLWTGFDGKNNDYFGHREPGIPFMKGISDDCELQKGNHCWISIWDKTRHVSYKIEIVGMTNHRYQMKLTYSASPYMHDFTEDTDDD